MKELPFLWIAQPTITTEPLQISDLISVNVEGNLGTNGSLEFIFDRKGVFTIESKSNNYGFGGIRNGIN